ncbi:hypothetical protein JCM11641_000819 [Rhodosporidiobolus odoratus]
MAHPYSSYSPLGPPPPRPSSAGPSSLPSSSSAPYGSPSRNSSTSLPPAPHMASCSTTPVTSPALVRPSALSTRRELPIGQTRLRARSLGKGIAPGVHLSPTLVGSPQMNGAADGFLARQQDGAISPLARQRAESERRIPSYGSDEDGPPFSSAEGTEESGSTRSDDSSPPTPRDGSIPSFEVVPPSRRPSRGAWNGVDEKENWRTGGEFDEEVHPMAKELNTRNRSKSLEGQTRMSLRRGRSFTSLLGPPVLGTPSPLLERKEPILAPPPPIFETYEPPSPAAYSPSTSDIESGEERLPSAVHHPTSGSITPASDASPLPLVSKTIRDFVPQLVILFTLFLSSFAVIAFTISTLPGLFLPHSVSDLPSLTAAMTTYRASSFFAEVHLFTVLTLLFLWKQCFSIPGSILTNILFGALYGTGMGTLWACLWTATGSTGAYLIAVVIAPLVEYYFATPLNATRRALKLPTTATAEQPAATAGIAPLTSSDLFSHLMLARLFPLLPYSVLNVISGVLRLPLSPFFITLLLGSFPFNFATVSIGELVALAAADPSTPLGDKIWSKEVVLKLVAVTLVSVVPVIFKEHLKRLISSGGVANLLERAKSLPSGSLFGFSSVPHASTSIHPALLHHHHSSSAPLSSSSGGPRHWRRKLSRSIGGAGEYLQLAAAGAGLSGRRGYERVSSIAVEGSGIEGGRRHEMSEGVEEMEMGGLHVGVGGLN